MSKSAQNRKKRSPASRQSRPAVSGDRAGKAPSPKTPQPLKEGQKALGAPRPNRIALIATAIVSLAIALYIGFFVKGQFGLTQGILWGALAGASIWAAFYGSFWINRKLRRRE
jgi:hypothetical protein